MKKDIKDYTLQEFEQTLISRQQPKFHARQIFSWLYQKGAEDFSSMSDLPKDLRKRLADEFSVASLATVKVQESADGTKKFLFKTNDGFYIEAVTIPAESRLTACISSQAGCKFGCSFCESGASGFKRNLSASEILDQLRLIKNDSRHRDLTHVVFMGTGEPLDNYDHVLAAIRIINADYGFGIGARRITVSTCGIVPGIKRLAQERLQIELSVSLHAADDETRTRIMPVDKAYPLKELIKTLRWYQETTGRQVTFEYLAAGGLNCDLHTAGKLCTIVRGLDCKVNLIPVNPHGGSGLRPPNKLEILLFRDKLFKSGIPVTLRKPRGRDIDAACGQLRLRYDKK
ncbi:MAG: 23S rRNA (adenine(2503)-C(2))-methyltransferase RlmN [Candidatus Omnitrophica bacterium]|nr:23S rRNA (adenine(2503)-C(2))-methyltransferase RlmN [Candidatus Omnitrophota bacterium]